MLSTSPSPLLVGFFAAALALASSAPAAAQSDPNPEAALNTAIQFLTSSSTMVAITPTVYVTVLGVRAEGEKEELERRVEELERYVLLEVYLSDFGHVALCDAVGLGAGGALEDLADIVGVLDPDARAAWRGRLRADRARVFEALAEPDPRARARRLWPLVWPGTSTLDLGDQETS